jgi:hypothetical protein
VGKEGVGMGLGVLSGDWVGIWDWEGSGETKLFPGLVGAVGR